MNKEETSKKENKGVELNEQMTIDDNDSKDED